MKVEKFITDSTCSSCSKGAVIFKIDRPLDKDFLKILIEKFEMVETTHFTDAGILYVHNSTFIVNAPFGADRLTLKCKLPDCTAKVNEFQSLLESLG